MCLCYSWCYRLQSTFFLHFHPQALVREIARETPFNNFPINTITYTTFLSYTTYVLISKRQENRNPSRRRSSKNRRKLNSHQVKYIIKSQIINWVFLVFCHMFYGSIRPVIVLFQQDGQLFYNNIVTERNRSASKLSGKPCHKNDIANKLVASCQQAVPNFS